MSKIALLALLAAALAVGAASPATAKPPGTNGLISFTRFDPALGQDVVYTINPDGTHEQQLMAGAEAGQWAPDGTRIAIGTDCCGTWIVNPDTGSYTQLPTFYPDLGLFLPCGIWSPDGARLACEGFGLEDPADDGVYTISSLDGSDVRRVTAGADDDCAGDYAPNGKRLVFLRSSFDFGPEALYVVRTDGTAVRRVTPPGMELRFNCGNWSPQGNEILFSARVAPAPRFSIFAVHTDGSGLREIPISTCGTAAAGCFEPVWSPDGTKIAFTMFVSLTGQSDLYTVNADGTGPYQVTHSGLGAGLKDWGTHPLTR